MLLRSQCLECAGPGDGACLALLPVCELISSSQAGLRLPVCGSALTVKCGSHV